MHYIPGCRMRCDEETEILGVDDAEMGEFAYDYVGIDAQAGHVYHDDTHSHSDVLPTTGGREPMHKHTSAIVVEHRPGKDGESTGESDIEKSEQH
jgi:ammonium transporter, Amt family